MQNYLLHAPGTTKLFKTTLSIRTSKPLRSEISPESSAELGFFVQKKFRQKCSRILKPLQRNIWATGQRVTNAVVTNPAYFNEGRREATKDAAAMAGLTAVIMTEPVAAAVAYRLERSGDSFEKMNVLVFDLGGGTFDVAVLTISNWNIDVKTINGDTHLGGEDFDKLMVKLVIGKIKARTVKDPLKDKVSRDPQIRMKASNFIRRLKIKCERKKRALSTAKLVRIIVEQTTGWSVDETVTSDELEELIRPHLQKCMAIVDKALIDAKMNKNDIHDVVLVGGSTKIPKVQEMLSEYFNGMQLKQSIKIDQAVAYGAAIQAAIKWKGKQGDDLMDKITIQNVTPITIGLEAKGGGFVVQVPKGSKVPFVHTQEGANSYDYQEIGACRIFEGEDKVAVNNHFLGEFVLRLPAMKEGKAKVEIATAVNQEGIVAVFAVCRINGAENSIVIDTDKGRMTKAEIEERRVASALRRA